jgi:small subunit ribosomal protein S16
MAVKLRLTRVGSKKNPIYRVVAADSRSPRDGKFIEIVGRYNPQSDPSLIDLDEEKVRGWLEKGAQPELARRLVDEPGAVRVEEVEEEDGTLVLRLHVAEADIGKVIGRQGRLARALRTIVRAGGVEAGRRLQLEIVD